MESEISLSGLTFLGMGATIFICAFIIGLTRILQVFFIKGWPSRSKTEYEDLPVPVIIGAALASMNKDYTATGRPPVWDQDETWSAHVRDEISRTEGYPAELKGLS
jgi:hypothetical protein